MTGALALFAVEVRRCLARRLTRVLLGLAVVASVVAGIVVFTQHEKDSPAARAAARARVEQELAFCVDSVSQGGRPLLPLTQEGQIIIQEPGQVGPGPVPVPVERVPRAKAEAFCREGAEQRLEQLDPSFHLTTLWPEEGGDGVLPVTFVFLGIGALIGASSMVGAEWKAGTFTTLLTWEPRRVRVAVTKLAALAVLGMVAAVVLQLVLLAALWPAVALRGSTAGADADWVRHLLGGAGRGAVLAGMGAVLGGAVAMLGRSTSATLGVAFAYLAVGEAIVRAWKPRGARWLLGENSAILLTGQRLDGAPFDRPLGVAVATLVAYTVGLGALTALVFRRRDVT